MFIFYFNIRKYNFYRLLLLLNFNDPFFFIISITGINVDPN